MHGDALNYGLNLFRFVFSSRHTLSPRFLLTALLLKLRALCWRLCVEWDGVALDESSSTCTYFLYVL